MVAGKKRAGLVLTSDQVRVFPAKGGDLFKVISKIVKGGIKSITIRAVAGQCVVMELDCLGWADELRKELPEELRDVAAITDITDLNMPPAKEPHQYSVSFPLSSFSARGFGMRTKTRPSARI